MKNTSSILFFGLCPLIPAVTHFAEGCIFACEFWLLFLTALLCNKYIKQTKYASFSLGIEYICMLIVAAMYHTVLRVIFPLAAFQLTFYLYISAVSYLTALIITQRQDAKGEQYTALLYSILLPVIGLIRELCAFGSVSFAVPSGFFRLQLFSTASFLRFFGSNAGAFILLGIGLWLFRSFQNRELLPFQE